MNTEDIKRFLKLDAMIKDLEKEKELLSKKFKTEVKGFEDYDPMKKYLFPSGTGYELEFSTNKANTVLVEPCLKIMDNAKLRHIVFPYAVTFKPGEGIDMAVEHGLVTVGRSEPVLKIIKPKG